MWYTWTKFSRDYMWINVSRREREREGKKEQREKMQSKEGEEKQPQQQYIIINVDVVWWRFVKTSRSTRRNKSKFY